MNQAVRSTSDIPHDQRLRPRAHVRIPARTQAYSRFLLDSFGSDDDDISDVTIKDLSLDGTGTDHAEGLRVGMIVRLQIPLLGWRNAKVCWIRDGHAGCRFLVPLSLNEVRAAIAASPLILSNFPGLVPHIEPDDRRRPEQANRKAGPMIGDTRAGLLNLIAVRKVERSAGWPPAFIPIASIAIALIAWITLYALLS